MPLVRVAVPIPLANEESFVYEVSEEEAIEPGLRVLVPVGPRRVWGTVLGVESKRPAFRVRPIAGIPEPRLVVTKELLDLCRWVADYYAATLGEVLQAAAPSPSALRRRATASPAGGAVDAGWHATEPPRRERLNEDQLAALERLETALGASPPASPSVAPTAPPSSGTSAPSGPDDAPAQAPNTFLLYGVTGSGKTAVYLHAAAEAIRRGGQALILVPEIALSPQALDAFRRAGIERTAIYHSTLRPRERADVWRQAAAGELDLIVGTRSAVFLPFRNLRFIAVDEEQDGAYKQEDSPRYNARDVALVRAKRLGAAIVLSSATPSLESYAQVTRGAYALLHLPHRVDRRPLATVRVADLRVRARGPNAESPRSRYLSPMLLDAMERTLERREQAILFLNRRGHSTYLQCRGCGEVARCSRCDVSLTVHAEDSVLRCHYCGAQKKLATSCSGCGAADLWFGGVGIQKVEREVARLFPAARLARLDLDAVRKRGAAEGILRAFRGGETDLLLGTQMVTKGFDFPGVTLVGIVVADLQLHLPDFRAAERTFQLLTQVAGRAGRGDAPGEVIMQSYNPEHPALRCAAAQDFAAFYRHESAERRELGYPPFGHLIEIEVRGKRPERVMRGADEIREVLKRAAAGSQVQIFGPAPKPLSRIKGKERWHLLLRSPSRSALRETLTRGLPRVRALKLPGLHVGVDVDPRQLL